MTIKKTEYHSYSIRNLPNGCKYCVKGEKLVLFITGLCDRDCFYCPLSEKKKNKDVIYANEWDLEFKGNLRKSQLNNIIKEAKFCNAKGAGITGGDPILVINRTVSIIKALKKEFGNRFHIHLYTPLKNISYKSLKALYQAGLDEIRFHPVIWDKSLWDKIIITKLFDWDIGVEIPSIPGYEKQTKELIDYLKDKIDFLNINELEISDTNANKLVQKGFRAKNRTSYAVKGSEELALRLMKYIEKKEYNFKVHYCTCKLKDAVQLANRIKKRAKNISYRFDKITDEGMLIRGAIYLKGLAPSFGYRKKLAKIKNKREILSRLKKIKKELNIKDIEIDENKLRLVTSEAIIKEIKDKLKAKGLVPAIVEEYPTHDATEVEVELL